LTALKERNNLDTTLVEDLIVLRDPNGEQGGMSKVAAQCSNYITSLPFLSTAIVLLGWRLIKQLQ
jgi:hypothetical protein